MVQYPLYQDEANRIAETLESFARILREEPDAFPLDLLEMGAGGEEEYLKLEAETEAPSMDESIEIVIEARWRFDGRDTDEEETS